MNYYYLESRVRSVHMNFWRCLCDILLRHSILQLRSVVIFDNFVLLVSRFFWLFRILARYDVINMIGTYKFWVCYVGLGARSVVSFLRGEPLCVEVPVTLFRLYLGMVTCFGVRLCWGGGGG